MPVNPSSIEISVKSTAVLLLILKVVWVLAGAVEELDPDPPHEARKKMLDIARPIKAKRGLSLFMINGDVRSYKLIKTISDVNQSKFRQNTYFQAF